MQQFLEVMLPAILVFIFGAIGLTFVAALCIARVRLYAIQCREAEARRGQYASKEIADIQADQAAVDAVILMISEMAENPATYSTMTPYVSEALYKAAQLNMDRKKGHK